MAAANGVSDVDIDLGTLFASIARDWRRILLVAALVTLAAFALAVSLTPHYRAETRILIETRESVFTRPETGNEADRPILDEEGVTSQVEVISSTDLLKQVADKLQLAERTEFGGDGEMSLLGRMLVLIGLKSDPVGIQAEERVVEAMRERLNVFRIERSRVIVIQFSSEDPRLAADVPNAIAEAYLAVQQAAKLQSNADATDWLEPEIADLRERVKAAEGRVAAFRSQSDLLVGQNNAVLATQQLSEMSTELSRVRAARSAAEGKGRSLRAALDRGAAIDTLPDVLSSALIQRLRERQVQLKADIADLSTTLLDNHPRLKALRSQLANLEGQIRAEAGKVLQALETEAETARFRETQLLADLNTLKAESARAGDEEVELRALEREAAAQRELLESYLTRYREAASRSDRNYLPVDARVFSRASAPSEPYFPKVLPIVGATFIGSLLLMVIVTLLRELFSGRAMRSRDGEPVQSVERVAMPAPSLQPDEAAIERASVAAAALASGTALSPRADRLSVQAAAESIINGGASRAIFISPEGDEAAATAVLVAREVADAGLRVLLLDLTASGAASGPMLDGQALPGITNLLAAEAQFTDVIHADHYSACHVMPVGTTDPARAMRAADRLPIIMNSLTTAYDLVVVECGPAGVESIRRLVGEGARVLLSVLEPANGGIAEVAADLRKGGYEPVTMVSPEGYEPELSRVPEQATA